jgi:hypothetical protein
MPERQYKLNEQRKQREPRAMFGVCPEPLHAELRPPMDSRAISALPM